MGIPDGAHTHSSGGGLGTAILVIVGAALAVRLAAPVAVAIASLITVLLWTVGIVAVVAVAAVAAYGVYRWRHSRRELPLRAQATVIRPQGRQLPPTPRAIEQHVHHHWYGVSAEDVAAIIERRRQDG
jgi:hypothetical protein